MRIFLTYSSADLHIASPLSSALRTLGYEVIRPETFLEPGDDIERRIKEELLKSDALVLLWSAQSGRSGNMLMEVGFFVGASDGKPIIPVVLDGAPLPLDLASRVYISARDEGVEDIALKLASALSRMEGEIKKDRQVAAERKHVLERTTDSYIAKSLQALSARELRYQRWGLCCYLVGYLTILGGLGFTVYSVITDAPTHTDVAAAVFAGILTVAAIGFLGAAARFAFVLGRSFMVEALRNHDRSHAIKFGEFYLKAFGDKVTWPELKEAFQHWNLDTGSSFKDQKEDSVDPQLIKSLVELLKSVKK